MINVLHTTHQFDINDMIKIINLSILGYRIKIKECIDVSEFHKLLLAKFFDSNKIELKLPSEEYFDEVLKTVIFLLGHNFKLIESVKNSDTDAEYHVIGDDENIYIVFPGTNSFRDIYYDLYISRIKLKNENENENIYVYKGFYSQYKSIENQLFTSINKYGVNKKIYLIGHSLGAAIASIFSYYLYDKKTDINLITFGSPKVGNYNWMLYFKKNIMYSCYK
jgi:hypothetical protein